MIANQWASLLDKLLCISMCYCLVPQFYTFYSENTWVLFSTLLKLVSILPCSQNEGQVHGGWLQNLWILSIFLSFQSNKPVKEKILWLLVFAALVIFVQTIAPDIKCIDICDSMRWATWVLRIVSDMVFFHHVIMNGELIFITNSQIIEVNKKILVSISGHLNCYLQMYQ